MKPSYDRGARIVGRSVRLGGIFWRRGDRMENGVLNTLDVFEDPEVLGSSLSVAASCINLRDPGMYLYRRVLKHSFDKKFSPKFIELAYVTLSAWNGRSARLSDYKTFKSSLKDQQDQLRQFSKLRIDKHGNRSLFEGLNPLWNSLSLVPPRRSRLITFSRALHFYFPDLIVPMDRKDTLGYFQRQTSIPGRADAQFQLFVDIQTRYAEFSGAHSLKPYLDKGINRTVPKLLDTMVMGWMRRDRT